ncbi:MAG: radical SAM protein [Deltaproteobacteria bacterium]|nr:radical SAM protein [Deltaproteobacteria bacterium]
MESKSIHLVNIAVPYREGFANMKRPPAGILYVGGHLKKHGFHVIIHHILREEIAKTVRQIISDNSLLFAGFSLMTGKQVTFSAEMSSMIKSLSSEVVVVWGGVHPSLMPKECLAFSFVDYVVIGEGEITALELAQYLSVKGSQSRLQDVADTQSLTEHNQASQKMFVLDEIHGLGFKRKDKCILTPERAFEKDIDTFRQDWDLIDPNRYVRCYWKGEKVFFFITSRGCPHSCGFCYNLKFNRRRWRAHSPEFVINELLAIQKRTGIDTVCFPDDNFFTNKKRALHILHELKKHGISCRWVEIRADEITEDLISELAELGLETIVVGWESGSQKTLDAISKKLTPQMILEATRILSKFKNITFDASAIIGFPWEDEHDINETIALALKMFEIKPFKFNVNLGIYLPFPGAPITVDAIAQGLEFPKDPDGWLKFDRLSGEMELPWMNKSQIKKYTVINKYFNLLYVFPLRFPLKQIAYIVAILSYIRLKTRVIFFPFEIWLTDMFKKEVYKGRLRLKKDYS